MSKLEKIDLTLIYRVLAITLAVCVILCFSFDVLLQYLELSAIALSIKIALYRCLVVSATLYLLFLLITGAGKLLNKKTRFVYATIPLLMFFIILVIYRFSLPLI